VVVSSKGKKTGKTKIKQNCTKQNKNPTKSPKFKCNTVSACRCGSVVFSSKVGREKKRVWRQFCEWLSVAVACLPTAVSLLLLAVLFMQISGVSLALIWPCRLCLLRFLLWVSLCYNLSPFQALGEVTLHPLSQARVFIYSSHGKWVFPPLLWSFPPTSTFTSFPAPDYWACAAAPAFSEQHVYLHFCEGLPTSSALRVPHPLCYVSFLFLLLIIQFLIFSLGGGQSVQGAMLIWPRIVCGSTVYHLAHLVVHVFPSLLGTAVWQHGSPPGFSVFHPGSVRFRYFSHQVFFTSDLVPLGLLLSSYLCLLRSWGYRHVYHYA
jgi:hypothetical protein